MQIGNKEYFGIECYHEPISDEQKWIHGRMCMWVGGNSLGDLLEPACALSVTVRHLTEVISRLDAIENAALFDMPTASLYTHLDTLLYGDDKRSLDEVVADAERYFRFDFLTNGGESFDKFKSFVVRKDGFVKVLFSQLDSKVLAGEVSVEIFKSVICAFLDWARVEGAANV